MAENNESKSKNILHVKKSTLLVIILIFVILLIVIAYTASYAFWTNTTSQTSQNEVDAGCFSYSFEDNYTNISLLNEYPKNNEQGKFTDPYIFTLTNTCSLKGEFNIYIHNLAESILDPHYLNVYITDFNKRVLLNTTKITNLDLANLDDESLLNIMDKVGTINDSYLLQKIILEPNDSITLNLRMWIHEDAPNSIMNKSYYGAVSVIALPIN